MATEEEDLLFIAVKDLSWGIAGIAEDKNAEAYYASAFQPDAKKKPAEGTNRREGQQ